MYSPAQSRSFGLPRRGMLRACRLTGGAALACTMLAGGLRAQGAAPAAATPAAAPAAPASEQVVTLPEFDVAGGGGPGGYMPTESATGSRIAIKVKDLPYAISAVTSEFVKDFGITSLTDELAFSSSMNGLNDVGGFSLRGYGGNISLRNGFARLGFFDPAPYDRIEFIKGPAASIYGQTNPGGIVNFVTKQPKSTPHESFSQTFGSYKLQRSELELTGPIATGSGDPKLFYLVESAYAHRAYESPNQFSTTREVYVDFLYKFTPNTSLGVNFDYEYMSYTGGTSGTSLPEVYDITQPATSTHQYTGIAWNLIHKYYTDASQWNHRTIFNYEGVFQSKLSDIVSIKAAGAIYRSPRFSYSTGLTSQYDPTTGNLLGRNGRTNFSYLQGDGVMGSFDAVAKYNIAGQGEQKTLFTVDYYKNIGKRPSWSTAAGTTATTFNVNNPVFTPFLPFTTPAYTIQSNNGGLLEDDYAAATGASLRQFGNFFNNKLIVGAGVRVDRVYEFKEALVGTPGVMTTLSSTPYYTPTNWSKEIGVIYVLTPNLNAYVNRAESFVPNSPANLDPAGKHLVNQTGVGYEAGLKGALLDNKLNFTADVFDIKLDGVSVTEFDPVTNQTVNIADGTQYTKGVELDGNWQATDKIQFLASASYNKAYYGNQGVDLDLKNRPTVGVPKNQATSAISWEVMPGLKLTAKSRTYTKFRVDNTAGTARIGGLQINSDGRRDIWGPGYTVVDLGAVYSWKGDGGIRHKVQLQWKNVFDKTYVIVGSRVVGDKMGAYFTYSFAH